MYGWDFPWQTVSHNQRVTWKLSSEKYDWWNPFFSPQSIIIISGFHPTSQRFRTLGQSNSSAKWRTSEEIPRSRCMLDVHFKNILLIYVDTNICYQVDLMFFKKLNMMDLMKESH